MPRPNLCYNFPTSVITSDKGVVHEIGIVPGANTVSHDSGPCLRSNVMSLMMSSAPSTRQEWYVRVNLHIRHRHFVSKSRTASGVLYMLATSLMRLLFRHRHPFLESMFFKTTWLVVLCIVHSTWSMNIIVAHESE